MVSQYFYVCFGKSKEVYNITGNNNEISDIYEEKLVLLYVGYHYNKLEVIYDYKLLFIIHFYPK